MLFITIAILRATTDWEETYDYTLSSTIFVIEISKYCLIFVKNIRLFEECTEMKIIQDLSTEILYGCIYHVIHTTVIQNY